VFVNIFAGTLSCKTVAEVFIQVAKSLHWQLPCVMRLCGNGAQEGRQLLQKSGLQIVLEHDLLSATQQMVAAVPGN
jgi:succinyl-CoA synthetase beta subunit